MLKQLLIVFMVTAAVVQNASAAPKPKFPKPSVNPKWLTIGPVRDKELWDIDRGSVKAPMPGIRMMYAETTTLNNERVTGRFGVWIDCTNAFSGIYSPIETREIYRMNYETAQKFIDKICPQAGR